MSTRLHPGDHCAGHEIIQHLGTGDSADVYLARAPNGELRAFKLMTAEGALVAKLQARFAQEGETLASIVHPNVVRFYDAGLWRNRVWLLLEHVEGETLGQRLRTRGRPPLDDLLHWIQQACEGLAEAHRVGVVHRDLTPDNLLILPGGGVKVIDFGLAKPRLWSVETTKEQHIGSARYSAPEQTRGARAHATMDIYAIGHMLYEGITGEHAMGNAASLAGRRRPLAAQGAAPAAARARPRGAVRPGESRAPGARQGLGQAAGERARDQRLPARGTGGPAGAAAPGGAQRSAPESRARVYAHAPDADPPDARLRERDGAAGGDGAPARARRYRADGGGREPHRADGGDLGPPIAAGPPPSATLRGELARERAAMLPAVPTLVSASPPAVVPRAAPPAARREGSIPSGRRRPDERRSTDVPVEVAARPPPVKSRWAPVAALLAGSATLAAAGFLLLGLVSGPALETARAPRAPAAAPAPASASALPVPATSASASALPRRAGGPAPRPPAKPLVEPSPAKSHLVSPDK